MKFTKNGNCIDCRLKCDIYPVFAKTGNDKTEINPLHGIFKEA